MSESLIYLDNNATTPLIPEVAVAMSEVMKMPCGNPSSLESPTINPGEYYEQ